MPRPGSPLAGLTRDPRPPRPRRALPIVGGRDVARGTEDQADRPDPARAGRAATRTATRADVAEGDLPALLTAFYGRVGEEPALAPYFATLDMAAHIPVLADFWATIVFQAGRYRRNAFRPHLAMPGLGAAHFGRWLAVFEATVDAAHAGPHAERMKAMAHRIAFSMQLRLGVTPAP